jgi:hypothetical protein
MSADREVRKAATDPPRTPDEARQRLEAEVQRLGGQPASKEAKRPKTPSARRRRTKGRLHSLGDRLRGK